MAFSAALARRLRIALGRQDIAVEFLDVYNVTTAGVAEASKALVLDSSKGIATITSATITTLTSTTVNCTTLASTTTNATTINVTNVAMSSGNLTTDVTTGLKILGNNTQKLGLYGATPIVQPATVGELIGMNGNGADNANAVNMNSNGNLGTKYWTFGDAIRALKQLGALAVN